MKFIKDKDGSWSLITKKSEIYFTGWCCWYDLALPLHINIEWFHKDYTEIQLHVLGLSISFTRIGKKYGEKLDKMLEDYKNEKN